MGFQTQIDWSVYRRLLMYIDACSYTEHNNDNNNNHSIILAAGHFLAHVGVSYTEQLLV